MIKVKLEITADSSERYQFTIRASGDCYIGGETDGGGHDEAVIVIGVFADQIDASGSTEDSGATAE